MSQHPGGRRAKALLACLPAAVVLVGAAIPPAAHASAVGPGPTRTSAYPTAVFRVSFYGIQRYSATTTSRENPASGCFDVQQRGVETGSTVARFESSRPVLLTVTRTPGLPGFAYRATEPGVRFQLPAATTWTTSGSTALEVSSCVGGSRIWHAAPQPRNACGSARIPNTAGSILPETATTILFAGGQNLGTLEDPLAGCAYGEHQYGLYQARGRYSIGDLFDPGFGKHLVVLRGHRRATTPFHDKGGIGSRTVDLRTTVYVTFVRTR